MASRRRGGKASKKRKETAKRVAARRGLDSLVNQGRQDDNYRNQRAGIESVIQDVSDAPQRFAKNKESRRDFILRNTRPDGSLNSAALAMLAPYDDDRSEYSRDLNRFMKSSPENTRAYAERFPKTYSTMTGLPNIIKNSIPGLGMASRIFEAAQGLRDKPVIKEAVDTFQNVILDPTVNAYNIIADGTPGKTNIQRTFNPENVAVPGPERLSAAQNNLPSANFDGGGPYIPDVSGYQGGVPEMLSEEEVNELVFDPSAGRYSMDTETQVKEDEGPSPVVNLTQEDIVNLSGTGDVEDAEIEEETEKGTPEGMTPGPEAEAAVDAILTEPNAINPNQEFDDTFGFNTANYQRALDKSKKIYEDQIAAGEEPYDFSGQPGVQTYLEYLRNTTPGPASELEGQFKDSIRRNVLDDYNSDNNRLNTFRYGRNPSYPVLGSNFPTYEDFQDVETMGPVPRVSAGIFENLPFYSGPFDFNFSPDRRPEEFNTFNKGGIASFANGGYNYINGNTMNNESLTASANIDDRIMKNLQYEKMAPGMMGYKNGGLTSLNNSDYNKLKSTYQYMGDF